MATLWDSLLSDLVWAHDRAIRLPVYRILNHCRVYAYIAEGHIYSKREGAHWALERLPAEFYALIAGALVECRELRPGLSGASQADRGGGRLAALADADLPDRRRAVGRRVPADRLSARVASGARIAHLADAQHGFSPRCLLLRLPGLGLVRFPKSLARLLAGPGHCIMERKQLLGIKQRAEQVAAPKEADP